MSGSTARNRMHRERRGAAVVAELEHLQEHLVRHDVGVEAAAGHDVHDVEDLEDDDGDRDRDRDAASP